MTLILKFTTISKLIKTNCTINFEMVCVFIVIRKAVPDNSGIYTLTLRRVDESYLIIKMIDQKRHFSSKNIAEN